MKAPTPELRPRSRGPGGSEVSPRDPDPTAILVSNRHAIVQALALADGAAVACLLPPDNNSEPGAIRLGWDIVLFE